VAPRPVVDEPGRPATRDPSATTADATATSDRRALAALLAATAAMLGAELVAILVTTRGHFTYSLDDGYIHLSLARSISHGHYGLNPGEASSPSSSPLWPFVLALTARAPFAAYVPLAWNWLFTLGSAALVFHALRARFGPPAAAVLGGVAVLGLNLVGVAYTGLEHSLQVMLALVAATGVVRAWSDRSRPLPWWFLAALVLGPLVRYEMAAVSVAAVVALWGVRAYRRRLVAATVGWVAPLASFSGFLVALGLDPLPSSVLAKSAYTEGTSPLQVLADKLEHVGTHPCVLAIVAVVSLDLLVRRGWTALHTYVAVVMGAHLAAGEFGWYGRYELYALAAVLPPIVRLAADWEPAAELLGRVAHGLVLGLVAVAMVPYAHVTLETPLSAAGIAQQQGRTAVFVRDHWQQPVAVNDIGEVAWVGGQPVLDVWGLADQDARKRRMAGGEWLPGLVARDGVRLAVITTIQLQRDLPSTWLRVGALVADVAITNYSRAVDVYVTDPAGDPGAVEEACAALRSFAATATPGTQVEVAAECAS
jgi:hypothetical protein